MRFHANQDSCIHEKARPCGRAFSEGVATFGLVLTILLTLRAKPQAVAACVGLYIGAALVVTALAPLLKRLLRGRV